MRGVLIGFALLCGLVGDGLALRDGDTARTLVIAGPDRPISRKEPIPNKVKHMFRNMHTIHPFPRQVFFRGAGR
jgi:hypothetical protein